MTREGAHGIGACEGVSRISQLMSPSPITVKEAALVRDVLQTMAIRRIRHILVVDADGRLTGLVTHGDLTRPSRSGEARADPSLHDLAVERVMRRQVATVGPDCCTGEAARYMFRIKRGCLPVVDEDRRPTGIVTKADFLREFMRAGAGCGCSVREDDWPRPSRLPA